MSIEWPPADNVSSWRIQGKPRFHLATGWKRELAITCTLRLQFADELSLLQSLRKSK